MNIKSFRTQMIRWWSNSKIYCTIDRLISANAQKKLTNKDFTILCSNCIGGIIYHRLGMQFLSPTINMWFYQPDFAEFCIHLDWYLQQELHFIDTELNHPVGILKGNECDIRDIKLFFNHDSDCSTALNNWERRKKRIDQIIFLLFYITLMALQSNRYADLNL